MDKLSDGEEMQTGFEKGLAMVLMVGAMETCANSQAVLSTIANASPSEMLVAGTGSSWAMGRVLRVIDDPHTGARWLLVRDDSHPTGPGRLLLIAEASPAGRNRVETSTKSSAMQFEPPPSHPVIRSGDRVVVEENSAVANVRLEAVALGPAGAGSELNVRLKISGKVLRAKALGTGRAEILTEVGVRR